MRITRTIGWTLALGLIGPVAVGAQTTHNLSMHERVRVLYASGTQGGTVEGNVSSLTQDSLGLALPDDRTMTLAWDDIAAASVWRIQKPKRYIGGLMGGVIGAGAGAFVAVDRSQNRAVGGELSATTVGKGAVVGAAAGILVGVGVAQLLKPHGWQRVNVHTQVASRRPSIGLSLAVGGS